MAAPNERQVRMQEFIAAGITEELCAEVIRGSVLDVDDIAEDRREEVCLVSLQCVMMGPVGVGRESNFINVEGLRSIRDIAGIPHLRNKAWKDFCRGVANQVKAVNPNWRDSQSFRVKGDLWPIHEDIAIAQAAAAAAQLNNNN